MRDARTRASICDAHVFAVGSESPERREIFVDESCVYQGGGGFSDVFSVEVGHPRYQSARREGIRARDVRVDECTTERIASVDIELEP